MPTEQCDFLILYIHGILYMYITKYSCVFLKLGESIYVAMDLIPMLLGALPLAHNAQHSLVISLEEPRLLGGGAGEEAWLREAISSPPTHGYGVFHYHVYTGT